MHAVELFAQHQFSQALDMLTDLKIGALWCGVVWCGVVWCGVVWCGVVWCGVVWCGVVWCGVVWCGVVWRGVAWCGVVGCGVVWCGVVWCGAVWYQPFSKLPFSPRQTLLKWWVFFPTCFRRSSDASSNTQAAPCLSWKGWSWKRLFSPSLSTSLRCYLSLARFFFHFFGMCFFYDIEVATKLPPHITTQLLQQASN